MIEYKVKMWSALNGATKTSWMSKTKYEYIKKDIHNKELPLTLDIIDERETCQLNVRVIENEM